MQFTLTMWVGWARWVVACWHRNFLSTLRGYGPNQDTAGGLSQATGEG